MRGWSLGLVLAFAGGWMATETQVGFAQPPHHRGVPRYRIGIQLYNPLGIQVTDQREQYRYVVPSGGRYGTFYSYDDGHYYTPPVARIVGQEQAPAPRPVALQFGGFNHHAELAERLEMLANQFCLDLHYNYQENPGFDETYAEAYKLLQAAKYVHDKEHQGDHAAIQRYINSIDELFHHVQGDIQGWRSANRRPVGQLNLAAKTEEFEAVLHHLMFEVGVKPAHDDHHDEAATPREREEAPPPRRR
ncbi:MAG: hypothetical protein SH850_13645 [Planctomycetaceae bacterium]|nr:hypothetical protein [Planctomycetaceae bacterium]